VIEFLKGNFKDFDTDWYFTNGAKISMTMITNCLTPFIGKLFEPILVPWLRCCCDRDKKKHLLKESNIQDGLKQAEAEKK
jgi:hypothetical protein